MGAIASPAFARIVKKLDSRQKKVIDKAVLLILEDLEIGSPKVGDLRGVRVFKFKIGYQEWLLAYEIIDRDVILLLLVGPHENFYRDLKHK